MDTFLQKQLFFNDLPPGALNLFVARTFTQDEFVFTEGESPSHVYLLKSGLVKSVKSSSDSAMLTIDFIMPGHLFGMIAVLDRRPYPVSAIAIRESQIFSIPQAVFDEYITRSPSFRKEVFRQVGNHLRNTQVLRSLMQKPVEARIAHILDYLSESMGSDIRLLREDIAAMAGCTESTAIKTLAALKESKIISTGWKKIAVTDPAKLKSLLA